jgi:hypothetical protein
MNAPILSVSFNKRKKKLSTFPFFFSTFFSSYKISPQRKKQNKKKTPFWRLIEA